MSEKPTRIFPLHSICDQTLIGLYCKTHSKHFNTSKHSPVSPITLHKGTSAFTKRRKKKKRYDEGKKTLPSNAACMIMKCSFEGWCLQAASFTPKPQKEFFIFDARSRHFGFFLVYYDERGGNWADYKENLLCLITNPAKSWYGNIFRTQCSAWTRVNLRTQQSWPKYRRCSLEDTDGRRTRDAFAWQHRWRCSVLTFVVFSGSSEIPTVIWWECHWLFLL